MSTAPLDAAEEIVAYESNCSITRAVGEGFRLETHLTAGRVDACQGILDEAAQAFFEQGLDDVLALERLIAATSIAEVTDAFFMGAQTHAHNLRGQAQILGFTLITKISGHMIDSIEHPYLIDAKKFQLVRRITEVLRLAFNEKIQDAGGPKALELLALIEAYLASQH